MANSALRPPNSNWFSDDVISAVVQRSRPSNHDRFGGAPDTQVVNYDTHIVSTGRGTRITNRSHENSSYHANPRTQTSFRLETPRLDRPVQDRELSALERHRERRRLTQIRYRKKLKSHGSSLENEVQLLRDEVADLEAHYRSIAPRVIENMTPWNVVAEYFRLFHHALTAYVPLFDRGDTSISDPTDAYESKMHRDFLETTMAPDAIVDNLYGVDTMMKRWKFISMSQPNFDVQVDRLENGPSGAIVAITKIQIIMCDNMLHYTFPHLAKSQRGRYLASKLRGQRFEIAGSSYFLWDNETGCMLSLHNNSDPMTPILRFLGNLEDLAFVFDEDFATLEGRTILSPSA